MRPSNMRVRLRLFGPLKDTSAAEDVSRDLAEGQTVSALIASLRREGLLPEKLLLASAVAVNHIYAKPTQILQDGDEVAIIPPVSGGRL